MAKVKIERLTAEQLTARHTYLLDTYDAAAKAAKAAEQVRINERELLRQVELEIERRALMTTENMLEAMLETYLPSGENTIGYKWLQDKSWKGDWKDTGLIYAGSTWNNTNQRILTVRIPSRSFTDQQLSDLEKLIQGIMPSIKAGAYDAKSGDLKLMSKGSSVPLKDLKVLSIQDPGCGEFSSWNLAEMPDGNWVIFDAYTADKSWGRARLTGTLLECLQEVRQYLSNDPRNSDDDEDDN